MSKRRRSPIPPGTDVVLVSSCLVGKKCCYDGKDRLNNSVKEFCQGRKVIDVCPEVLAGLNTPRVVSEIASSGDGESVLNGASRVIDLEGHDLTDMFIKGAREALKIAKNNNIKYAIMKSNSPSCGVGSIYDGSFSHTLKDGDGVTTALLKREGIEVVSDKDLNQEIEEEIKMISFNDFKEMELAIGTIKEVQDHPDADKLYVLKVSLGSEERQLVAGIKPFYEKDALVGKQAVVILNIEPAVIRGVESCGMLLAARDSKGITMLTIEREVEDGAKIS